jgi:hypothetical protein
LQGTILSGADLCAANLMLANLQAANLSGAQLDERTILPDGEHWSPDSDLCRFTTDLHPLFWHSPVFVPAGEPARLSH